MLLIIIWYFFIIIFCLGLGLDLIVLASALASASASRFWPRLTSLAINDATRTIKGHINSIAPLPSVRPSVSPSLGPSVSCLRFSRNRKAVETSII